VVVEISSHSASKQVVIFLLHNGEPFPLLKSPAGGVGREGVVEDSHSQLRLSVQVRVGFFGGSRLVPAMSELLKPWFARLICFFAKQRPLKLYTVRLDDYMS
jgi:hypothetical protein